MTTIGCDYDVLIIGGGIVGLSVLRSTTLAGYKCILVEASSHLLSGASGRNSGIVCTGVDAYPGSLERALIRDSIAHIRPFLIQHNVPHRCCGSLVCQWPWDNKSENDEQQEKKNNTGSDGDGSTTTLRDVLEESHDAGDVHATLLSPETVRQLEPNLSDCCMGAVHIPGEIVVDPWLFGIALAEHARDNGATIVTNCPFQPQLAIWNPSNKLWTVKLLCSTDTATAGGGSSKPLADVSSSVLKVRSVVNAAGIQADVVQSGVAASTSASATHVQQQQVEDIRPHWTSMPRRGQYRIFSSIRSSRNSNSNNTAVGKLTHPIQPVPTQHTKGIFVFSTLYDQIVVGPTALDQTSRTDDTIDTNVAVELSRYGTRILPQLRPTDDDDHVIGEYVGIRPATNKRDYQIRLYPEHHWIAAAGIRSTGLTASLGIGRYIVDLLQTILPLPSSEEEIQHPSSSSSSSAAPTVKLTPLPPVKELVEDFHSRGDGTVVIRNQVYRVTHPLTILGWEARTGIAAEV